MSNNLLSIHAIPMHMRPQDIAYTAALRPSVVKLIDADQSKVARYLAVAPNATFFLRDHPLSEQHNDMVHAPEATGKRHAAEWHEHLKAYDLPRSQAIVSGVNEPHVWDHLTETVRYTVAFLDACTGYGISAAALNLSVGWPANRGGDTPPDWTPYEPVRAAIQRGIGHVLCVHEYFDHNGPAFNWGWWCGRILKNSWDVPIIIGEAGLDEYVSDPSVSAERRGWQAHLSPVAYAEAMREYCSRIVVDNRVIGVCVFTTDYAGREWRSFDTEPAQWELGAIHVTAGSGYLDAPVTPIPPPVEQPEPESPQQTTPLLHPCPGARISQHWGENGDQYARFGLWGHNGTDLAAPSGTPVYAIADGEVAFTGEDVDYGIYARIWHAALGCHSFYAHLATRTAVAGATVSAGEQIGTVGSTGNSTGPHLHLELRLGTRHQYASDAPMPKGRIDPESFFAMHGANL